MVGYYRLNNLGFRLEAGAHIISRDAFSVLDAANDLVATAEAERLEILEQAKSAYEEERRKGYAHGMEEARIEAMRTLLHDTVELDKGLHAVERDLVRVVSECVRKIIASFDDTQIAEEIVRASLQQMRREPSAELRVSSHLYGYFRARVSEILKEFPEVELLDVILDSALQADQIVLETSIGRVEIITSERIDDILSIVQSVHVKASADRLDALRASYTGAGA